MKQILIRIAGGLVATVGFFINRGHAYTCSGDWTYGSLGGVNYLARDCVHPARDEYYVSFYGMSGSAIAEIPQGSECLATNDKIISFSGCEGYCNSSGIVCENTPNFFTGIGCCIVSGNLVGMGHDCEDMPGVSCKVSYVGYMEGILTEYVAESCASGYYVVPAPSGLGSCSGFAEYSNPTFLTGCCSQCSGLQYVNGNLLTVDATSGTSSGILIDTISNQTGPESCVAKLVSGRYKGQDAYGTFEISYTNADTPTEEDGCTYTARSGSTGY